MLKKEFWFVIVLLLAVSFLSVAAGSESQQKCYFIEAPVLFHEHEQSKVEALGALQEAQKITTVENSLQFDRALDNRLQFDAVTDNKIGDAALAEDQYRYYGHFDYTGKVGTTRAIQRIDLFQPFLRTDERLMFFDVRIGNDSHKNYEYNLGLGFREMASSRLINGFYAYLDGKRSPNRNLFHNITTGYELLFSAFEARINAYIPIGRRSYKLKEITHTHNNLIENKLTHKVINNNIYEKSFGGFDIEIGGAVPYLPQANLYATYYRFMASGMDAIDGVRVRGTWEINKYFSMEASADFGKKNNHAKYIGFKITIPFGQAQEKPSVLERKMVSLPTRDIDIPSAEGQNSEVISHEIKTIGELDNLGVILVCEELQNHEQFSGNLIFYAGDDDIHMLRIKNLLGNNSKIKKEQFKYIHFHKKNAGKKLVLKHCIDKLIKHGHDSEDSILDQTSSPLSYDSFSNSSSSTSYSSQREGKSTSKIKKAHRLANLFSRNKETIETSTPLLEDPIKSTSSSSSNTNSSSDMSDFSSSYSSESDDISTSTEDNKDIITSESVETSTEDLNEYFSGSLSSSSIDVKTQTDLEDQAHQDKIKALEGDRDKLTEDLGKIQQEKDFAQTELDQLRINANSQETEVSELRGKLGTQELQLSQLKQQKAGLEEQIEQLNKQINNLKTTNNNQLNGKDEELNKVTELLRQKQVEVEKLTEQAKSAKEAAERQVQQQEKDLASRDKKINETEKDLQDKKDEAQRLQKKLTETEQQVRELDGKITEQAEELTKVRESLAAEKTQSAQLGKCIQEQENTIQQQQTTVEQSTAEIEKLRTENNQLQAQMDSNETLRTQLNDQQEENKKLQDKLAQAQTKTDTVTIGMQTETKGFQSTATQTEGEMAITTKMGSKESLDRIRVTLALPATNTQRWTQDNGKEGNFGYDSNSKEIYYKGIRVFFRDNKERKRYKYVGNLGDSSPFSSEQKAAIEKISHKKHRNQIQDVQNALQELAHSVTLITVENRHTTEAKKTRDGDKHHYIAGDLAISRKLRNQDNTIKTIPSNTINALRSFLQDDLSLPKPQLQSNEQDLKNRSTHLLRTKSISNLSIPEASTEIQVSSTTSPSIAGTPEISKANSDVDLLNHSAGDSTALALCSPSVSGSSTRTSSQNSLLTTGLTSTLPPAAPLSENKINTESNPQFSKTQTLPASGFNPPDKAEKFKRNALGTQSVRMNLTQSPAKATALNIKDLPIKNNKPDGEKRLYVCDPNNYRIFTRNRKGLVAKTYTEYYKIYQDGKGNGHHMEAKVVQICTKEGFNAKKLTECDVKKIMQELYSEYYNFN